MELKINYKKVILYGLVVLIIDMLIGNLLYMNPYVSGVFESYKGHPSIKPIESFGGIGNYITLTMIFGIILFIFLVVLYLVLYNSLPGKGWIKGLSFGIMVGFLKAVPEAFNQFMNINYPVDLIYIQLFNTFFGLILFGLYLDFIFRKTKTIIIINS